MKSSNLSQLNKTIQARNDLRNMFQANQLRNMGLYEQAARMQEPFTKTITETAEETKRELKKVRSALENQPNRLPAVLPANSVASIASTESIQQQQQASVASTESIQPTVITPDDSEILNIINHNNETSSTLTNNTLTYINTINDVKAFSIGSGKNKQLFGLKDTTLVNIGSNEEYLIPSVGVAKLLFHSRPTEDGITKDDVDEYKSFLDRYNFSITQDHKRKIIQKFYPNVRATKQKQSLIESVQENPIQKQGQGISLIVPSDPNKLREELILQLSDTQAGNNNNFNYTNAIMKEMLSQKLLTSKEYRRVLNNFFHI